MSHVLKVLGKLICQGVRSAGTASCLAADKKTHRMTQCGRSCTALGEEAVLRVPQPAGLV